MIDGSLGAFRLDQRAVLIVPHPAVEPNACGHDGFNLGGNLRI
jgi:hypothetical protein